MLIKIAIIHWFSKKETKYEHGYQSSETVKIITKHLQVDKCSLNIQLDNKKIRKVI